MVFSLGFHGINHEPYPQLDPNEGQCHNVFMETMTVTVLDLGVFSEPIGVYHWSTTLFFWQPPSLEAKRKVNSDSKPVTKDGFHLFGGYYHSVFLWLVKCLQEVPPVSPSSAYRHVLIDFPSIQC